ncbi:MAG: heavy metal translocating P-type ATPase [Acholeplasmataceae bacterium]|nr:heavy metal translocating P-type ATPase [Acholeplasmataceae bacterium]
MKRKYEFDNVPTINIFDDIVQEINQRSNFKIELYKDKFYFYFVGIDDTFEENVLESIDIIKKYIPNIELKVVQNEEVYRKIIFLENLDCANCAAKVERIAKKTLNNENIIVDFATTRFIIETTDEKLVNNLVDEVKKITSQVDNNINPVVKKSNVIKKEEPIKKVNKILFIVGASIVFITLILHYIVFKHTCDETFNPDDLTNLKVKEHLSLVILYGISYILLGFDVLIGAIRNIKSGHVFDEKFLMSIATIMAFIIGSFTEACMVMIFYKIGEILQEYAVNSSRKSINSLINIKPEHATMIVNDTEVNVDPAEIVIGDIIVVKPGERIPLDGIVIEGEASLDAAALTGESKYVEKKVNDEVISGTINVNGYLKIRVTKSYDDSMVSKIVDMVSNASIKKAKSEAFVTKFAKYYTPCVCIIAAVIIALNLAFFQTNAPSLQKYLHDSIYPGMILLVISCPCALVISVPLGFFGGIGGASKQGILVKGSNYLENLSKVGLVVFDKTGTLTKGNFIVNEINPKNITSEELLRYAAYAETGSIHPVAKSIINKFGRENINFDKITYLPSPSKKGTVIKLDDKEIAVGNYEFTKELGMHINNIKTNGLVAYVIVDKQYVGNIILIDELREESKKAIDSLKQMGINVAMITGDTEEIAKDVAYDLGIEKVYANMTPIDKVKRIRKLKKRYGKQTVAFVGDGMNDAPVLSCADVGIAMGGFGSDAAIEVADIVLMQDDLLQVISAIKLAKKTVTIIKQNIIFALIVKGIVLLMATIIPEYTKMSEGVFADVGVSLIAILNSLRACGLHPIKAIKNALIKRKALE